MFFFFEILIEIIILIIKVNRIFVKYLNLIVRYILKKFFLEDIRIYDLKYYYESLVFVDYEYDSSFNWYYTNDPFITMDFTNLELPKLPPVNLYRYYRQFFYNSTLLLEGIKQTLSLFAQELDEFFLQFHYGIGFDKFDKKPYNSLFITYLYSNPYKVLDEIFFFNNHYYLTYYNDCFSSFILRLPLFYINIYTSKKIDNNLKYYYENNFFYKDYISYFYQVRYSYFYFNYDYELYFIFDQVKMLMIIFASFYAKIPSNIIIGYNRMYLLRLNDYFIFYNQCNYDPNYFISINSYVWNPYLL